MEPGARNRRPGSSGNEHYLVSLSVTTDRAVAIGDAPATDAIINGFRVSAPGTSALAPSASPAAQPPATAPVAQTPAVTPLAQTPANAAPAPVAPAQVPAAPVAAPARLPAPAAVPNAAPNQAPQPLPNLLSLVPGLPPLPNFSNLGL